MKGGILALGARVLAFAAFFLLIHLDASATHLRAGEITVTRVNCTSLTFNITITVFTNTGSTVKFSMDGAGTLDFGDGSTVLHPPEIDSPPLVPGYSDVGMVVYTVQHTYSGSGRYSISYTEPNRNAGILNITNSVGTQFEITTVINLDSFLGCDDSPQLTVPPIDKACTGVKWMHNAGAYDPYGDSLSYEMVVPMQDPVNTVFGYQPPNTKGFYDQVGIPYATANQAKDGPPTFGIDPVTGTVTWDSPGAAGEYNIAFHIIEWRKVNGVYIQVGYVTRDMQIIVQDCQNHPPVINPPPDLCVTAGTKIVQTIQGTDPDGNAVEMQAFSQVFSVNPSPATFSPSITNPPTYQPQPATLTFTWQTECAHVREQPYEVVLKVVDNPSPNTGGVQLASFATWNITVVAPAPLWTSVTAQPTRSAKLIWQPYACATSADSMQIWRRVNSYPYSPPPCVTGMPDFLGYTLIARVPIGQTQFIDNNKGKGLAPGAEYCYRLVASFPQPSGGLSYVSQESCFTAKADAPLITNVTIDKTSQADGQDTVKWVSPLLSDIDTTEFKPPYSYLLYRAEGFSGSSKKTLVFPGKTTNTFYIDGGVASGLNTAETVYNYQVVAYSDSGKTTIDSSATASTVRLELKPHFNSIELNWTAAVPWSNQNAAYPVHYIYRGPPGSTVLSDMTQIDTVNVTQQMFHYVDSGQYNHTPLDKSTMYCYCVKTQGSYGNPKIAAPLINFSEIICAQPNDTTRPCPVKITATGTDCSKIYSSVCSPPTFSNLLTWAAPTASCATETYRYNVYVALQTGGAFTLYAPGVADTFYVDQNLPSFARCYKVSAVNRAGIESPLSDAFCFDNCPHYELPNVFTPGNGDDCNDLFSAYSDRTPVLEGGSQLCPPRDDIKIRCARFVNSVNFTVINRWGKEVFTYQSGGENTIFIDWDGRDDQGQPLPSGTYYYLAQVNFDVVDPSKRNRTIKGWLQLVR
jgi:hypothetical protein